MNRLAQLLELSEGKMRNARLWWDQTKPPAQSTRLFWSPLTNPPPPPPSPAELPTCPKSTLLLACEQQTDRKYVCYAQATPSSSHFKTNVTVTPQRNLAEMESSKNVFLSKEKRTVYFLGQHMKKHSTWDKQGQKGQSPTAASCLFICHITFTDAMSCNGVEGSHFVLRRLSMPFYTLSFHNSPILGHSWYSKR